MAASPEPADSPFAVSVRGIVDRPGTQQAVNLSFPAPAVVGTDVIGIPEGADLRLDVSLESVSEGIWVSGNAMGVATGECGRCLDAITHDVAAVVNGLFVSEEADSRMDDHEDVYRFEADTVDLEEVVRDAVADALPFTPLCSDDCPGLCDQCGASLVEDPTHAHNVIDPRWSVLESLGDTGIDVKKER